MSVNPAAEPDFVCDGCGADVFECVPSDTARTKCSACQMLEELEADGMPAETLARVRKTLQPWRVDD